MLGQKTSAVPRERLQEKRLNLIMGCSRSWPNSDVLGTAVDPGDLRGYNGGGTEGS